MILTYTEHRGHSMAISRLRRLYLFSLSPDSSSFFVLVDRSRIPECDESILTFLALGTFYDSLSNS